MKSELSSAGIFIFSRVWRERQLVTFPAPKTKIELEPSTQTVPENNATNANFTRTDKTQPLAGANRDVMQTMVFLVALFFLDAWERVTCIVQKQYCSEDC